MGTVRFGVHDVVNIRFAISPLGEAVAAFRAALDPGRHAVHLPWLRPAVALLGDRDLARRTAPLADLARRGPLPDALTPPPRCPLSEFEEELARAPVDAELAEAVRAWWRAAVAPHWPRMRALQEADIAHRTRQLAEDGIQEVFAHLHPTLSWEGDRLTSPQLRHHRSDFEGVELGGTGVTLAPTVFGAECRLLAGDGVTPPALVYPARALGTLWERRDPAGDGLARLMGRSRARLLAHTSSPSTTTQLAARTGLSPGAVSQHLAVLRDAGLVTSHRYRREVHYTASDLGTALLRSP
ncbi:ArsR family transcriptional regulator [Streptomyces sp. NPDC046727]|uniref:ArsR/SmtB family transcription factor n=1 Tax=Streptomyces sp. NPDC046727 TaxID=3155373 RepID=UPI0033CFB80D